VTNIINTTPDEKLAIALRARGLDLPTVLEFLFEQSGLDEEELIAAYAADKGECARQYGRALIDAVE
jgi:hypothetical protein